MCCLLYSMGLSTAQYQRSGSLGDVRDALTFNVLPRIPGCNDGRVGTRGCLPMQLISNLRH